MLPGVGAAEGAIRFRAEDGAGLPFANPIGRKCE